MNTNERSLHLYDLIINSAPLNFLEDESGDAIKAVFDKEPGISGLLSDGFINDMKRALRKRMADVFLRSTSDVLVRQMRIIDPVGAADPLKADDDIVYQAMEKTEGIIGCDGSYYYGKYPFIREFTDIMRTNFTDSLVRFLNDFLTAKSSVETQLFGGSEITRLEGLLGQGGDYHRHGRSVFGVKTNAGNFYYKPHDGRLDVLYHTLIDEFFSDCTVAADCVTGRDYGFVNELVTAPLKGREELPLYYANFGRLTALFHGIGAIDMHLGNIIPSGIKPCAVDLETMFRPEAGKLTRNGAASKAVPIRNSRNVIRTGVLPACNRVIGMFSPLHRSKWFQEDHLPECGGELFTVEGFEKDFLCGFEEGYERVLKNRDRIRELFRSSNECELRFLLRNTEYYNRLRQYLWTPKALSDRKEQRRILDRLRVPFTKVNIDVNEDIVRYEEKCLLEGDIPYYCTALDGRDLCGCSVKEVIAYGFMEKSAREMTFENLSGLCDEEKLYECDVIRNAFRNAPKDTLHEAPGTKLRLCEDKDGLCGSIRSLIPEICDHILESQIRRPGGKVMFFPYTPHLEGKIACTDAIYPAEMAGILHLAYSHGFLTDQDILAKALSAVRDQIERWQTEDEVYLRAETDLGFCEGIAAIITALDGIPAADDIYAQLLNLVAEKRLYLIEKKEQTRKLSELMIAIGRAKTAYSKKTDLLRSCADSLNACFDAGDSDAMGLAAAGAAFAISCGLFKEEKYKEYAENSFERVNSLFNEKICGWPKGGETFKWMPKRSEYSPYIGLCACLAADVSEHAGQTAELSVKSVLNESELRYCDSLYHGNALTVKFLASAAGVLDRPDIMEHAGNIAFTMMDRKNENGAFHTSPAGIRDFFDASSVFGVPGIGATLLQSITAIGC
ncbi:MAG TPA: hypothetical protein DIS78_00865 [Lachnospiraceae bacterium]|nr:hypothetical protein [Lachnospiraceae bacterium]